MSTPFMQLYVADYLGDTRHLTTEQHGAYLLLLMAMWRAGGFLPADDSTLARIVGLTPARWNRIKGYVVAFLNIENGQVTQKRLLAELQKAEEKSQKRAEAGRVGGTAKALKENKPPLANASSLPEHSSEPEPESEIKKKKEESTGADAPPDPKPSPKASRKKPKTGIPEDFPGPEQERWALSFWAEHRRPDLAPASENDKFRDYAAKNDARYADWPAAWRTWCRNALSFNKPASATLGDRHGRKQDRFTVQPAAAAIDQAIRERGGGSLFDRGGPEIIDITPRRDSQGDPDEEDGPGWPAHAA